MKTFFAFVCALVACGAACAEPVYRLEQNGTVTLGDRLALSFTAAGRHWKGGSLSMTGIIDTPDAATGTVRWQARRGKEVLGEGRTTLLPLADGRAYVRFSVTMTQTFETEAAYVSATFRENALAGAPFEADQVRGVFPEKWARIFPFSGMPRHFVLEDRAAKRKIAFDFAPCTSVQVQDDRKWSPSFSLRVGAAVGHVLEKGRTYGVAFFLGGEGAKVTYAEAHVIRAGGDWVPFDGAHGVVPGSALDFSRLPFREAPAGRHGWLRNAGGDFAFEGCPDRRQRFYGVNLCGSATCPEPADADLLLDRFERAGYNAIRIHHYARMFLRGAADGRTFDSAALSRFDAFFAKAKARGFYVTTDLFVSRDVTWRDLGIDREGLANIQVAKGLFLAHEPAFQIKRGLARRLMV